MKIDVTKLFGVVLSSLPQIIGLVRKIEVENPGLKGPAKKEIVMGWAADILQIVDGFAPADLTQYPEILSLVSDAVDLEVAAMNARAKVELIIAKVKAAKAGEPDPTPELTQ